MGLANRWKELHAPHEKAHPWYPHAVGSINAGLWATVLEPEDSGWTQTQLESRAPLLDMRIQRFLLSVPPIPLCIDKELLRRAVRGLLPEQVRVRVKTPFRGDLLAFQIKCNQWRPLPPHPHPAVLQFVDWSRLQASIENAHGGNLWRDLRPFSLLYWLQNLEAQPAA